MPRERCSSSRPPVHTRWPFFPTIVAVPVSWHIGQHEAGRDLGVAQQREGDAAVVLRGLGVVEDGGELGEVPGPVEERDVAEGLPRDEGEGLGGDLQDLLAVERRDGHEVGGDLAVGRLLLRDREGLHVAELGHGDLLGVEPGGLPPA